MIKNPTTGAKSHFLQGWEQEKRRRDQVDKEEEDVDREDDALSPPTWSGSRIFASH